MSRKGFRASVAGFQRQVMYLLIGILAVGALSMQALRVNGPLYAQIVDDKDLVADILPPPEYVVEAYLEATLARDTTASVLAAHAERLAQLHKDFDDRQDYWRRSALAKPLKQAILGEVGDSGRAFWSVVEGDYLPALKAGDPAAVAAAYGRVQAAYEAHRATVDRLVAHATDEDKRAEALAHWATLAGAGVVICLLAGGILLIRRRGAMMVSQVVEPLADMTGNMSRLAGGDLSIEFPHTDRDDELGEMARALRHFHEQALEASQLRLDRERNAEQAAREQADNEIRRTAALKEMAERVELETRAAVSTVADGSRVMADQANAMARLAADVGRRSHEVSQGAAETLVQTQSVAATANELDAAIQSIRRQVEAARDSSNQVAGAASEADEAIGRLTESVSQISKVTQVIDDIARQTNLLALNAGVEAARAGDAGRGFAVVAQEVRALAQQTADATAHIRGLIDGVEKSATETIGAVGGITQRVGGMDEASLAIAGAVEEQASATLEIARSVAHTNTMAERMVSLIEEVAREAHSAGEIAGEVDRLSGAVGEAVTSLSATLVRVVRTSTSEVDRRAHPRLPLALPVNVRAADGHVVAATLRDLSVGGAAIIAGEGLAGAVTVDIPGAPPGLRARVVRAENGVANVQFTVAEGQSQAIEALLQSHGVTAQAA